MDKNSVYCSLFLATFTCRHVQKLRKKNWYLGHQNARNLKFVNIFRIRSIKLAFHILAENHSRGKVGRFSHDLYSTHIIPVLHYIGIIPEYRIRERLCNTCKHTWKPRSLFNSLTYRAIIYMPSAIVEPSKSVNIAKSIKNVPIFPVYIFLENNEWIHTNSPGTFMSFLLSRKHTHTHLCMCSIFLSFPWKQ